MILIIPVSSVLFNITFVTLFNAQKLSSFER